MKTKEEVIKEAWGHNIPNGGIDENGWSKNIQDYNTFDVIKYDHQQFLMGSIIRPKSIKGIENNNGWHIVDLENLPNDGIYYIGKFDLNNEFTFGNDEIEWYDIREYFCCFGFTHYQQIIKPLKPLY